MPVCDRTSKVSSFLLPSANSSVICGDGLPPGVGFLGSQAQTVGFFVAALIYAFGHVSAFFNPVVTLGACLLQRLSCQQLKCAARLESHAGVGHHSNTRLLH